MTRPLVLLALAAIILAAIILAATAGALWSRQSAPPDGVRVRLGEVPPAVLH